MIPFFTPGKWKRRSSCPAGFWVALACLLFVGAWCLARFALQYPPLRKIGDAYGSAVSFASAPQFDSAGGYFAVTKTMAHGYGLFVGDTATGRAQCVHREDSPMRVWSWSPDGGSFVYTAGTAVSVYNVKSGGISSAPATAFKDLAWLAPNEFVGLNFDGARVDSYWFAYQPDWTWRRREAMTYVNPPGAPTLRSGGANGSASASGNPEQAAKAFDLAIPGGWTAETANGSAWLQYEFTGPAWVITQYRLTSSPDHPDSDPRDWRFAGSLDGVHWTTLDFCVNQSFSERGQTKTFAIRNQTPYPCYRLTVTATAGGGTGLRLGKVQLLSEYTADEASASGANSVGQSAAAAFDGSTGSKWFANTESPTWWLQYKFGGGAAWAFSQYSLTSGNDMPERDPQDWELQASNDGFTWETLDTRTNETFDARTQTLDCAFANLTPYRIYRLNIAATRGGGKKGVQLAEFHLGPPTASRPVASADSPAVPLDTDAFSQGVFCLTALSRTTIAWGQGNCIWTMSATNRSPELRLDFGSAGSRDARLRYFSYSPATGQFLLTCWQPDGGSLWTLGPDAASPPVQQTTMPGVSLRNGVWLEPGGNPQWACLAEKDGSKHVLLGGPEGVQPSVLYPNASVETMGASRDGRELFFLGAFATDAAPGVWRYDLDSKKLRNTVPYAARPFAWTAGACFASNNLVLPSGSVLTYYVSSPPASLADPHRKRPLLIMNSQMGSGLSALHHRLPLSAVAACGAYAVIIDRPGGWFDGIEKWGDNVAAVYPKLVAQFPQIDTNRVFLFGCSAETYYTSQFLDADPAPWKGVILFVPSALPHPETWPADGRRPKILILAAELDHRESELVQFQEAAVKSGVEADVVIYRGETHFLVGNTAELRGTRAMINFIFDE